MFALFQIISRAINLINNATKFARKRFGCHPSVRPSATEVRCNLHYGAKREVLVSLTRLSSPFDTTLSRVGISEALPVPTQLQVTREFSYGNVGRGEIRGTD